MGAVWSALLVGGGLAGALFVWLLRGGSRGEPLCSGVLKFIQEGEVGVEKSTRAFLVTLTLQTSFWVRRPLGPRRPSQAEHPQESNGCLISETRDPGSTQETTRKSQSPGEQAPSAQLPGTEAASETSHSQGYAGVSKNESPMGVWRFQKGQETPAKAAAFATKLPSSNLLQDRTKDVSLPQVDGSDLTDQEDWEMVSRHSSWGDVGLGGNLEALRLSSNQGMDCGRNVLVEARGQAFDVQTKKAAMMCPESQQVSVRFQVHYITRTQEQFIAVTGDHERLGKWDTYIPLQCGQDGLWSHSVSLPVNTAVQWKFVVVENGEVARWEECGNRFLETGQEDRVLQESWGIH
ncbi:PREDICTED: starch-binding domain-containing protein 1 [Elephantulus edwardii]|uniref:starch-binding domain-containing protein 1 n=1 Tax=Elephantulus edwardii TaxID=28737 RepID=UPI0003F0DF91|nr:PREDICTED: starch-binding domain-containing protein 1 [Elephantulus edwardii]